MWFAHRATDRGGRASLKSNPAKVRLGWAPFSIQDLESRLMLSGHGTPDNSKTSLGSGVSNSKQKTAAAAPLISLPAGWRATPILNSFKAASAGPDGQTAPPSGALSVAQIRGAYGLGQYGSSSDTFKGIQADGTGQTIVLVDAYDDPNALTDLNTFSNYYGLPTLTGGRGGASHPSFKKYGVVDGSGLTTTLPGTDPTSSTGDQNTDTWEIEESLDIEWAHAMAPKANIVLVESSDTGVGLYYGDLYGGEISSVVAVSNSWGDPEFSGETSDDFVFTTPSGHLGGAATATGADISGGVTYLVAAGDTGAYGNTPATATTITPDYPASSPNVVAVGGTALTVGSGNTWSGEVVWGNGTSSGTANGGGGGISAYETEPSYQTGYVPSTITTSQRTYPDVAMLASPSTGVAIVDSWDDTTATPWVEYSFGGTSLASPITAAIVAVADQGRAVNGLGSLDGASQTLPRLYKIAASPAYSADFHDITSGSNGYSATTGYDLASGIGSLVSNALIPDLVNGTSTTLTDNGPNPATPSQSMSFTATVTPVSGTISNGETVSLEDASNSNAVVGTGMTSSGSATITVAAGTLAAGAHNLFAVYGGDSSFLTSSSYPATQDVGIAPTVTINPVNTSVAYGQTAAFTAAGTGTPSPTVQWVVSTNGGGSYSPISGATSNTYTFTPTVSQSGDLFEAVYSNVAGNSASTPATLNVPPAWLTTTGPGTVTWTASTHILSVSGTATVNITADPGSDEPIIQASGSNAQVIITPTTSPSLIHLGGIQLTGGAQLIMTQADAPSAADLNNGEYVGSTHHGNHNVLVLGTTTESANPPFTIDTTSKFDLQDNDLIYHTASSDTTVAPATVGNSNATGGYDNLLAIQALVATGRNGGAWNHNGWQGNGLTSSVAALQNTSDQQESVQLAPVLNNDLPVAYSSWNVGSTSESVGRNDILVKYTYTGDFNLDGKVSGADYNQVLQLNYDNGATPGNEWAFGDTNGDGLLNGADFNTFSLDFNNGTVQGNDPTLL